MNYKEVFQLAQEKGYKFKYLDLNGVLLRIRLLRGKQRKETILIYLTLIQKWLRDEHKIHITIDYNKFYPSTPYDFTARPLWTNQPVRPYGHGGMSATYEEAILNGIHEALKLLP